MEKRNKERENISLATVGKDLKNLDKLLGVHIKLPHIEVDAETWVTLIEQFLMLILIVGRWLLPKGDLTRDQLSQLLLVYIGKRRTKFPEKQYQAPISLEQVPLLISSSSLTPSKTTKLLEIIYLPS